jgi:hypothetical protein
MKGHYQLRAIGGKVAENLFEQGLCLPSGTAMAERYRSCGFNHIEVTEIGSRGNSIKIIRFTCFEEGEKC